MAEMDLKGPRAVFLLAVLNVFTLCGCAELAKVPMVGGLFRTKPPYFHYLDNPRFSFEYPRKWGDGAVIANGVEFKEPEGRARFSIIFLPQDSPKFEPFDRYRRDMAAWGSVEDEHRVLQTIVSSHTAFAVQFTSYEYDPEYMLGQKVAVRLTESIAIPETDGMYVVRYQSGKDDFWRPKFRKAFEYFLKSLVLITPKKEE